MDFNLTNKKFEIMHCKDYITYLHDNLLTEFISD